ncbi:hypothetical protein GVanDAA622_26160 [Enterococcus faecium]|nr:hypothetical protein GVanDAA622_26160 [Enterococcus faecium]
MSDYIIETHDLTKKYGNQNSVSHLNIHVKRSYLWTSGTQWCRQDNDHADAAGTDSSHVR